MIKIEECLTHEFDGRRYFHRKKQWVDASGIIAIESLQKKLDESFAEGIETKGLKGHELREMGDGYKARELYPVALKFYLAELKGARPESEKAILPRVTSCYRAMGKPSEAIKLIRERRELYGIEWMSPIILTSYAAAYCDLNEWGQAEAVLNYAYEQNHGVMTDEMRLVYGRIDRNR